MTYGPSMLLNYSILYFNISFPLVLWLILWLEVLVKESWCVTCPVCLVIGWFNSLIYRNYCDIQSIIRWCLGLISKTYLVSNSELLWSSTVWQLSELWLLDLVWFDSPMPLLKASQLCSATFNTVTLCLSKNINSIVITLFPIYPGKSYVMYVRRLFLSYFILKHCSRCCFLLCTLIDL